MLATLSEFMHIDPQIKDAADQYLSAANILNDRGAFSGVLLPKVINAVFSIELYLKALNSKKVYNSAPDQCGSIVTAEPNTYGHDLSKLFNGLPSEIQTDLTNKYSSSTAYNRASFSEIMAKYSRTFVGVRYVFQDSSALQSVNVTELLSIANFMGSYVKFT